MTHSYNSSFLMDKGIAVSTARAGNVIGGGDFATDRIIPDCVRAASKGEEIVLRNPHSTRPFQHVLEPLFAYLMIAAKQVEDIRFADSYNVGPDDTDCVSVEKLVKLFCNEWGPDAKWRVQGDDGPHEASFLKLDCSRLKQRFGWEPRWDIQDAVVNTVEWYRSYEDALVKGYAGDRMAVTVRDLMDKQIKEYVSVLGDTNG